MTREWEKYEVLITGPYKRLLDEIEMNFNENLTIEIIADKVDMEDAIKIITLELGDPLLNITRVEFNEKEFNIEDYKEDTLEKNKFKLFLKNSDDLDYEMGCIIVSNRGYISPSVKVNIELDKWTTN